jgi:hypothetical protein
MQVFLLWFEAKFLRCVAGCIAFGAPWVQAYQDSRD